VPNHMNLIHPKHPPRGVPATRKPGGSISERPEGQFPSGAIMARLATGHNAAYWIAKVQANVSRDQRNNEALRALGWHVVRVWEGDVARSADEIAKQIARDVRGRA
jgi:hypothetical protein